MRAAPRRPPPRPRPDRGGPRRAQSARGTLRRRIERLARRAKVGAELKVVQLAAASSGSCCRGHNYRICFGFSQAGSGLRSNR